MKKEISVATVAKRMGRILTAYQEQVRDNVDAPAEAQSTSAVVQVTYSTDRGLDEHKKLLKFAIQGNIGDSDSDASSDESYALIDSPPPTQRRSNRTKNRGVKRTAIKNSTAPTKRKQRKVSSTITSSSLATTASIAELSDSDDTDTTIVTDTSNVIKTTTKKSTPIKATSIKASGSFNENDNRQATK